MGEGFIVIKYLVLVAATLTFAGCGGGGGGETLSSSPAINTSLPATVNLDEFQSATEKRFTISGYDRIKAYDGSLVISSTSVPNLGKTTVFTKGFFRDKNSTADYSNRTNSMDIVLPNIVKIGDSGSLEPHTHSDGSIDVGTWKVDPEVNGAARLILKFSDYLGYMTTTYVIKTDGTISKIEYLESSSSGYFKYTATRTYDQKPTAVVTTTATNVPSFNPAVFDGKSSTDPLGRPLTYYWFPMQLHGGSGLSIPYNDPYPSKVSITPLSSGEYTVGLVVFNGLSYSDIVSVSVILTLPPI